MKRLVSFLLLVAFFCQIFPLFAVDQYYRFPEQSVKGFVDFEKKRKLCLFPFRSSHKEEKFSYLSKGLPSVLFSDLRNLEYIYIEHPHPQIVYHSFGKNPEKTLQEKLDAESSGKKKKKRDIQNLDDLADLRAGRKNLKPEKDPRYIKLELKQIFEIKPPFFEDVYSLASKYECDFTLTGEFTATDLDLKLDAELFDEYEGKTLKFSHQTSFVRAYQEMAPLGEKIRKSLQGKETTTVQIETSGAESSLVYIDGVYLGKTPLLDKKFPIGKRELFVFLEGHAPYKQTIHLESGKSFYLDIKLNQIKNTASLSVTSEEEDADVYLGVQFLGKTPLENVAIPTGMNRLRVSKEGFVDSFRPVDAKEGELSRFHVTLRPGKSSIYYPNKQNVFLDHTYKDFATYSMYGSLLFYAGYLYFNYAGNKAIEAARPQVTWVNTAAFQAALSGNPDQFWMWYAYQKSIIDPAESKRDHYKDLAGTLPMENRRNRQLVGGVMVVGIGLMFVSAITFFALGLDEESFDIGFLPSKQPAGGVYSSNANGVFMPDSYSYFQYNLRF